MNDEEDYENFKEEFKVLKAESLLKKFVLWVSKNKEIDEKFTLKI